jgi:hypothetical protein
MPLSLPSTSSPIVCWLPAGHSVHLSFHLMQRRQISKNFMLKACVLHNEIRIFCVDFIRKLRFSHFCNWEYRVYALCCLANMWASDNMFGICYEFLELWKGVLISPVWNSERPPWSSSQACRLSHSYVDIEGKVKSSLCTTWTRVRA